MMIGLTLTLTSVDIDIDIQIDIGSDSHGKSRHAKPPELQEELHLSLKVFTFIRLT